MNTRKLNMLGWLAALALFVLNVPGMADDVLKLKSGASMTGRLLNPSEKNPEIYKFETTDGIQVEFAADLVEGVEHKGLVMDEGYAKKLEEFGGDTVDGNIKMAQWCTEHKAPSRAKVHWKRVLELDPDNALARKKLGYQKRIDGEWRTADEEMAEQGKVRYKGRYISKQEMESRNDKKRRAKEAKQWLKKITKWYNELDGKNGEQAKANFEALVDPMAIPALVEVLKAESKRGNRLSVKLMVVKALARIDTPDSRSVLVALTVNDPNEEVRMSCLDILKEKPDKGVINYLVSRLTPKTSTNAQLNNAALALGVLGDKTAIPALIEALVTIHKYTMSSGQSGQTSVGFGGGGNSSGGGFSFGESTQTVKKAHQNEQVLNALKALTGVNFLYDQTAWQNWYLSNKRQMKAEE